MVRAEVPFRAPLPCFLLRGVLSREGCEEARAQLEAWGFQATGADYPAGYRDNDRLVRDDPALAGALFRRVGHLLPAEHTDAAGGRWRLHGLNPRFRACRYRDGQAFTVHQDGAHAPSAALRSHLTLQLYLTDAAAFRGGATRYYAGRGAGAALLGEVRPEAGTAVVFDHRLWHDGEPVTGGTKYVLRTDVLYAREEAREVVRGAAGGGPGVLEGHTGYVWSVVARRDGGLASGGRDCTVRLWEPRGGDEGWRAGAVLRGHAASVTALAEDAAGGLWSGSRDRSVRRWGPDGTGTPVGAHAGAVLALCALPDGRVASGGADGAVRLWGADGTAGPVLRGHAGWVWGLAAVRTGGGGWALASGGEDGTVRLWDVRGREGAQGGERARVPAGAPVRALAALADGTLAAGGADGTVAVWAPGGALQEASQGASQGALPEALQEVARRRVHAGAVTALAPAGVGGLASGGEDGAVCVLHLPELSALARADFGAFPRGLVAVPGRGLVVAGYAPELRVLPLPAR